MLFRSSRYLWSIGLEKPISTISELIQRAPTMSRAVAVKFRNSLGTRLFNHQPGAPFSPGLDYNWELVYQVGSFGGNAISAWTVASETGFTFPARFLPRLALRADVASGAQNSKGGTLNTFNPLLPRAPTLDRS